MAEPDATVRAFYAALDEHRYDDLADLLTPDFTHYRPDRTFEGRDAFVTFMREDRPMTETTHEIEGVFTNVTGAAVQGRLLDAQGKSLFRFADVHALSDGRIESVRTYTQGSSERIES